MTSYFSPSSVVLVIYSGCHSAQNRLQHTYMGKHMVPRKKFVCKKKCLMRTGRVGTHRKIYVLVSVLQFRDAGVIFHAFLLS